MGRKGLVLFTLVVAVFGFVGAVAYRGMKGVVVVVQAVGAPSMGKMGAPVDIVLIEDFQCRNCREFSRKMIPKLQAEYIRSGNVRFTLVPVSFLAGSQAIANGALEVYKQNPEKFFPFLKEVLNHEGEIKLGEMIRFARRVGGIDLGRLQSCVERGCHNQELAKNLTWAQGVMGSQFRTPALYINGAPGSTFSFEAIQYQIDQILRKK